MADDRYLAILNMSPSERTDECAFSNTGLSNYGKDWYLRVQPPIRIYFRFSLGIELMDQEEQNDDGI